jgi:hypothetical protein
MQALRSIRFLLALDAACCLVGAVVLVAAAGMLAPRLALPEALLQGAGVVLLPWVAFLAWGASRERPAKATVLVVVGLNLAWALVSVGVLVVGWLTPNTLGVAVVVVQAAFGAGIAVLQARALPTAIPARRS